MLEHTKLLITWYDSLNCLKIEQTRCSCEFACTVLMLKLVHSGLAGKGHLGAERLEEEPWVKIPSTTSCKRCS